MFTTVSLLYILNSISEETMKNTTLKNWDTLWTQESPDYGWSSFPAAQTPTFVHWPQAGLVYIGWVSSKCWDFSVELGAYWKDAIIVLDMGQEGA